MAGVFEAHNALILSLSPSQVQPLMGESDDNLIGWVGAGFQGAIITASILIRIILDRTHMHFERFASGF